MPPSKSRVFPEKACACLYPPYSCLFRPGRIGRPGAALSQPLSDPLPPDIPPVLAVRPVNHEGLADDLMLLHRSPEPTIQTGVPVVPKDEELAERDANRRQAHPRSQ